MPGRNPHAFIDEKNRERDRRIASAIRHDSDLIERARENLDRWKARWGELTPAWKEWEIILRMLTPVQLADFLESSTPKAERLRQSSPFLGLIQEAQTPSSQNAG